MSDWLPELTDDDLVILLEAVEAWEHKDHAGQMLSDLVGTMMTRNDPEMKAKMAQERATEKVQREQAMAARKEQSIVLRAKLLTLRNRRRTKELGRVGVTG